MDAGRLDKRVTFQVFTTSRDAYGGLPKTWSDSFTVWGSVDELKGNVKYEATQLTTVADIKLTVRYKSTITTRMRFIIGDDYYSIYSVKEVRRQQWTEIFGKLLTNT